MAIDSSGKLADGSDDQLRRRIAFSQGGRSAFLAAFIRYAPRVHAELNESLCSAQAEL
jgi:hypothetical protein